MTYRPPRRPVTLQDYFKYPARPVRRGELLQLLVWYDRKLRQRRWYKRLWRWIKHSLVPPKSEAQGLVDDIGAEQVIEEGLKHAR